MITSELFRLGKGSTDYISYYVLAVGLFSAICTAGLNEVPGTDTTTLAKEKLTSLERENSASSTASEILEHKEP